MKTAIQAGVIFAIIIIFLSSGRASEPIQPIKIGIVPAPPFAMKNSGGEWEGLIVDFWKIIAARLNVRCEYRECAYGDAVNALTDETIDMALGRLSPLALHDKRVDFTHAFYFSGLGMAAVKMSEKQHWLAVLHMLRESNFDRVALLIMFCLIIFGVIVWFLERKRNPDHFANNVIEGIGSGLWWSATTMATVGYGDKVPKTFWGRLSAFFWIIFGIVLVAAFTATITSMSTVSRLGNVYERPSDLENKRLGTVAGSAGEFFLQKNGFDYRAYPAMPAAMDQLVKNNVDLVIDDQAALKYFRIKDHNGGFRILPDQLNLEGYSFIVLKNSPLRDQLNQAIKECVALPEWQKIPARYIGRWHYDSKN